MKQRAAKIQKITPDIALTIINQTLAGKKSSPINEKALAENLNSTGDQYYVRVLVDSFSSPEKLKKEIRGIDVAIEKLLKKIGAPSTFSKIGQSNTGKYNAAFLELEAAAARLDIYDKNDPSGNFVLNMYENLHELKKVTTFALTSLRESAPKKWDKPSADAWLQGLELPAIYSKYFRKSFGVSTSGDQKYGPGIRFIQACYVALFGRHLSGGAIDKSYKRYKQRAPKNKGHPQ